MSSTGTTSGFSQLTKIVAPSLSNGNFVQGMNDVFNNINENFKTIATLPFIQGVQGDSYVSIEKQIWTFKDNTPSAETWNTVLTEYGAHLFNCIFEYAVKKYNKLYSKTFKFSANDDFGTCKDIFINSGFVMTKGAEQITPIDFYGYIKNDTGNVIGINHNSLYFYAIINDAGEIEDKYLGQYYYFIDERLKIIGDVYNQGFTGISGDDEIFYDFTGFYQYNPQDDTYVKIDFLPTIYYDKVRNDICWKFNGYKTGISALGVKGVDGTTSQFQIALIENFDPGVFTAEVKYVRHGNEWASAAEYAKEGLCLVCAANGVRHFAFGEIIKSTTGTFNAYWDSYLVVDKTMDYAHITEYFWDMGDADATRSFLYRPKYIAIPQKYDRTDAGNGSKDSKYGHVIRTGTTYGEYSSFGPTGLGKLIFEPSTQAFEIGTGSTTGALYFGITGSTSVGITGSIDGVIFHNDPSKLAEGITGNFDAIFKNYNLEVTGEVKIDDDLSVTGAVGITGAVYMNDSLVVGGNVGITGAVNIGKDVFVHGNIGVTGNIYADSIYARYIDGADQVKFDSLGVNKNLTFSENKGATYPHEHGIYVLGSTCNTGITGGTCTRYFGTTGSKLTVWSQYIHLANEQHTPGTIYLGNGGNPSENKVIFNSIITGAVNVDGTVGVTGNVGITGNVCAVGTTFYVNSRVDIVGDEYINDGKLTVEGITGIPSDYSYISPTNYYWENKYGCIVVGDKMDNAGESVIILNHNDIQNVKKKNILTYEFSPLNIQPLGGDVYIHGTTGTRKKPSPLSGDTFIYSNNTNIDSNVNIKGPVGITGNVGVTGSVSITGTTTVINNKFTSLTGTTAVITGNVGVTGSVSITGTTTAINNKFTSLTGTTALIKANVGITGAKVVITGTTTAINNKFTSLTGTTAVINNDFTVIEAKDPGYAFSSIKTSKDRISLYSEDEINNDYSSISITPSKNTISNIVGGDLGQQSYIELKNENIDIYATRNIGISGTTIDIAGDPIDIYGNTTIKPGNVFYVDVDGAIDFNKASGATGTLKEYVKLNNEGNIILGSHKDLAFSKGISRIYTVYNRASIQCVSQSGADVFGKPGTPDPNGQTYSPSQFTINPYGGPVYIGNTSSSATVKGSLHVNNFTNLGTYKVSGVPEKSTLSTLDMSLFNYFNWNSVNLGYDNLTINIKDNMPHFIFCYKAKGDPNLIFTGGHWGTGSKSHNITDENCIVMISILNGFAGYCVTKL